MPMTSANAMQCAAQIPIQDAVRPSVNDHHHLLNGALLLCRSPPSRRSMRSFAVTLDPFDAPNALVTSPFFSSTVLASIRLAIACYTFAVLVFSIAWGVVVTHDAAGFYSYFTHLTYTGICGYMFAAGLQTLMFVRRGEKGYPLQRWHKALRWLHLALLSTITTFPLLVSLVFWAVIADSSTFDTRFDSTSVPIAVPSLPPSFASPSPVANARKAWSAISVHALNSVFALFEILGTNTPRVAWVFLPVGMLVLIAYTGVIYITYATQGFYAYSFMNPDGHPGKLALHIFGVGAAEVVMFCVAWGLVTLRVKLLARRAGAQVGVNVEAKASMGSFETGKETEKEREQMGGYEAMTQLYDADLVVDDSGVVDAQPVTSTQTTVEQHAEKAQVSTVLGSNDSTTVPAVDPNPNAAVDGAERAVASPAASTVDDVLVPDNEQQHSETTLLFYGHPSEDVKTWLSQFSSGEDTPVVARAYAALSPDIRDRLSRRAALRKENPEEWEWAVFARMVEKVVNGAFQVLYKRNEEKALEKIRNPVKPTGALAQFREEHPVAAVAAGVGIAVAAPIVAPMAMVGALHAVGFGAGGVAAGSLAAGLQVAMRGGFAIASSIGAGGAALAVAAPIASAGAAAVGVLGAAQLMSRSEDGGTVVDGDGNGELKSQVGENVQEEAEKKTVNANTVEDYNAMYRFLM
ncbi:hypothetical protein HMN09_00481100 [Mycena chlorophos]|uniref:Uncharacterized protein n=1 Tax=Mycena chlorophos TaxID=658473 RepID=A0A8H6WG51_MYCCL|nr:hypothetical protein HMN09_00481100 [Mycena chlorophos]